MSLCFKGPGDFRRSLLKQSEEISHETSVIAAGQQKLDRGSMQIPLA